MRRSRPGAGGRAALGGWEGGIWFSLPYIPDPGPTLPKRPCCS